MSPTPDEDRSPPSPAGPQRPQQQTQRQQQPSPSPSSAPRPPAAGDYDCSDDSISETAAPEDAIKAHLAALLRGYCTHIDARRWRAWGDLFADDAVLSFEYFGQLRGRREIVCVASGMAGFNCGSTTVFSEVTFELDARFPRERAAGSANLWYKSVDDDDDDDAAPTAHKVVLSPASMEVMTDQEADGGSRVGYRYYGPYHFDFVRTEGGWKIEKMALKVLSEHREEGDQRCTRCDRIPSSRCGTPCC